MKPYYAQQGATLIIILIITVLIMSLTAVGLEMSLSEFKSSTQLQLNTVDFYRAENCLQQTIQIIYSSKQPLPTLPSCHQKKHCANNYSLLEFTQLPPSWWQRYGDNCGKNIWSYTQLLAENSGDERSFYRISVYAYPHTLLQVTIGKSFAQSFPLLVSSSRR